MATKSYEELLERKAGTKGRVEMVFTIVADDQRLGGIEEADTDLEGALGDERMRTCISESLLALSFRPPPKDDWVTVVYPVELSPDDDDNDDRPQTQ